MPATKTERVPDYAISDDVRQMLRIRRLLAKGIPQMINQIQMQSSELKEMAAMADRIDVQVPKIALNEIEGQKG